jgi:hypothetical protein
MCLIPNCREVQRSWKLLKWKGHDDVPQVLSSGEYWSGACSDETERCGSVWRDLRRAGETGASGSTLVQNFQHAQCVEEASIGE